MYGSWLNRRLDNMSSLSDAVEEQTEMMDELLEKTRQLRSDVEAMHSATAGHIIVRVSRDNARHLQDAFSCAICKGKLLCLLHCV